MQNAEGSGFLKSIGAAVISCFFILSSSFLCGCLRREPPADVTIINNAEPESLDPAIITGLPEFRIMLGLFEGLMRLDPKTAEPVPGLAQSYDISPDGRLYTFHLRTNLVWSTGEPVTADDVVYSWLRAANPATASDYAGEFFYLKNGEDYVTGKLKDPSLVGVHATDKYTVQVELNHPTTFFLKLCTMPVMSVVPRQTIEKYGSRWLMARPLPSCAAFELGYWRPNDKIRLIKNRRYWDAVNTRSQIIDLLPVGSPDTALNLYENGQADIVLDRTLVPSELLDVLLKRPDFHTFDYLGSYFIRINVTKKPFDDARVRRALALAIDKDRIVTKITRAGEQPAATLVPPWTANYTSPAGLGYNPVRARKLLAEAGYPGGKGFPRFEYMFNGAAGGGDKVHQDIAIELQQMWRDNLGIQMDLRQVEWKVLLSSYSRLDYETARSSWVGDYNDANTFLDCFLSDNGNNRTGWKNAHFDALIHEANEEANVQKRAKLLEQAESLLVHDELPIIPIYYYVGLDYFDTNKIEGYYQNILDDHPLEFIGKIGRAPNGGGRMPK